ncbi:peroxidase 49-like [Rhodamnia argentea]|uniref:Peroxidase n=1 Tax=Rhodamnia argentea TaxID=178133 RepID=A0ABM3HRX8_9MYRT|nr:peroxidase 49-like [Rhodamnia argentea]
MAQSMTLLILFSILELAPMCFCRRTYGSYLYPQYYDYTCPQAEDIVRSVITRAVAREARMAASLIRVHFPDCFVQGCDGLILLDSTGTMPSEKRSNPSCKSARAFEVIEEIKAALEEQCPHTVSCADIRALAAGDSTVLVGGRSWEVPLGRKDSRSTSLTLSNLDIPAPNDKFPILLNKFNRKGLDVIDLVALLGSHTIGNARCSSFRQRLYSQSGDDQLDSMLDQSYASQIHATCPRLAGDQNLFFLDNVTPTTFDDSFFKNLLAYKGLLSSDQVLFTSNEESIELVKKYAEDNKVFLQQFAASMVKMGNISPLTGSRGEIRKICRKINS